MKKIEFFEILHWNIRLIEDNVNFSTEALKARYENERILSDKQVTTLINLLKIQKETYEEFLNYYPLFQVVCRFY